MPVVALLNFQLETTYLSNVDIVEPVCPLYLCMDLHCQPSANIF
jgi:hypothetical protein